MRVGSAMCDAGRDVRLLRPKLAIVRVQHNACDSARSDGDNGVRRLVHRNAKFSR